MTLPFTREQFFDVFAAYNTSLWPAAVILWIASLAVCLVLLRRGLSSRALGAFLAVHWAWAAIAYHLAFFTRINPAARLFGVLFLLEAVLLLWTALSSRGSRVTWKGSPWSYAGAGLCVYALLYPGLTLLHGHTLPRTPTFGVPCPTTLLTTGLLLIAIPPLPRVLVVVPIVWSAIAGFAAVLLGVTTDFMLFVAGALLGVRALWRAADS